MSATNQKCPTCGAPAVKTYSSTFPQYDPDEYRYVLGFTWEDVEVLRRCHTVLRDYEEHDEEAEAHLQLLADRIEGLLAAEKP